MKELILVSWLGVSVLIILEGCGCLILLFFVFGGGTLLTEVIHALK